VNVRRSESQYVRLHKVGSMNIALAAFSAAALLASAGESWLWIVALATDVSRLSVQSQASFDSASRVDDALVLRAVIEHTILPVVRQSTSGRNRAAVVLIEDRNSALCKKSPETDTPCRIPDHWQQFLVPNLVRGWPGMIDDVRRRRNLVEALEARNSRTRALPPIDHPAVVLIPVDRSEEAQQRYREQAGGVARLSVPGYSADGHALMYASYGCGSLCGYSWLFVLEKTDGVWRVQSAVITTIS
jgi:hypothetical protein